MARKKDRGSPVPFLLPSAPPCSPYIPSPTSGWHGACKVAEASDGVSTVLKPPMSLRVPLGRGTDHPSSGLYPPFSSPSTPVTPVASPRYVRFKDSLTKTETGGWLSIEESTDFTNKGPRTSILKKKESTPQDGGWDFSATGLDLLQCGKRICDCASPRGGHLCTILDRPEELCRNWCGGENGGLRDIGSVPRERQGSPSAPVAQSDLSGCHFGSGILSRRRHSGGWRDLSAPPSRGRERKPGTLPHAGRDNSGRSLFRNRGSSQESPHG